MPQLTDLNRPDSYYEEMVSSRNPKHDLHCMCQQCNKTPVCCHVCQYEFRHVNGLVRHRTQTHELKKGDSHASIRQRVAKREIIPDGLGYLIKAFSSPARRNINTEQLSKFAQHLQDLLHTKPKSRARSILNSAKLKALQEDQSGVTQTILNIPNKYLLPSFQMWEVSGVQPNYILLALIAYGLEYLAKELRQYPIFPEVTEQPEKKLTTTVKQKVQDDIYPSSEAKPASRPRFF